MGSPESCWGGYGGWSGWSDLRTGPLPGLGMKEGTLQKLTNGESCALQGWLRWFGWSAWLERLECVMLTAPNAEKFNLQKLANRQSAALQGWIGWL